MLIALSGYHWYTLVQNTFQSFALMFILVLLISERWRRR